MIVTNRRDLLGTARDARGPGWESVRMLVKSDGMGFSMTDTTVLPGAVLTLQYKNHVEACFCVSGRGKVTVMETGESYEIRPGVLYAPNAHDRHEVCVIGAESLKLVCTFSPALEGDEVHQADGSYAVRWRA